MIDYLCIMMKNSILLFLLFCLGLMCPLKAQERVVVCGYCKNEKGQPVENVSVYRNHNQLVAISDENGRFVCEHAMAGENLRFAHIVYENAYYVVKENDLNGDPVTIHLETKLHELLEVNITANAPSKAFDNPVKSVLDYVIRKDGIYLIAYRRKNTSLLNISFDHDTLQELKVPSDMQYLFKDFYDDIHILGDENAYQIGFTKENTGRDTKMELTYDMPRDQFVKLFSPILAVSDSVVITGKYSFYYLEQYYYCITPTADTIYLLTHIVDEERRDDLLLQIATKSFDRFTLMSMNLFPDPIYNPIYEIDNKFYLFAFTADETIIFDAVGHELERHPLTFHRKTKWNGKTMQDKSWKKKILVDEGAGQFYTYMVNDGLVTIKRINLEEGTAEPVIDLHGYPFAEKMQVYDGVLYFLYPTGNNNHRALYQVSLE